MIIKSLEHLESISNKIGDIVSEKDCIFLIGEIGVGKTTFTRCFINYLQKKNKVKQTEVLSPTFNLLNEYQVGPKKIKHYDLFRIKNKRDTNDLNIFEKDNNLITFVEWPELVKDIQEKVIVLKFNYENELNNRSVEITGID